jgi:hypothetical protein
MRRSSLLTSAALAGALGLGCSEQADVTAPPHAAPTGSPTASADLARATVSRFTDFVGDFVVDEEQQLSAIIGRSYETVVSVCTTGQDNPDTGLVQVVQRPDGSINVLVRAEDVNIVVWNTVLPPDNCGLFLSTTPFATGTGHYIQRLRVPTENGGFNIFGRFVGTVTSLETGQQYHFLWTGHIVVTPIGQVHFSGGAIKLTPIGG